MKLNESETISEDYKWSDSDPFLLRDVRVLAIQSRNKRFYSPEVCTRALPKFKDAPVYVNHDHAKPRHRRIEDRIGILLNPRVDEGGIRGDLQLCPTHQLSESIKWFHKHGVKKVALSWMGEGECINGVVKDIDEVISVDITGTPAGPQSLSEEELPELPIPPNPVEEHLRRTNDHESRIAQMEKHHSEHESRISEVEKGLVSLRNEYGEKVKAESQEFEHKLSGLISEVEALKAKKPTSTTPFPPPVVTQPIDLKKFIKSAIR